MIILLKLKMQKVFGIWYLKYQIPSPQKVFEKVFKCPQINMYLVYHLNTSFEYLTQHCVVYECTCRLRVRFVPVRIES